jgi:hypothetical protein
MKVTRISIVSIKLLKIHVIPKLARAEIAVVPSMASLALQLEVPTTSAASSVPYPVIPGYEGGFQRRGDDDLQNPAPKGPPRHQ